MRTLWLALLLLASPALADEPPPQEDPEDDESSDEPEPEPEPSPPGPSAEESAALRAELDLLKLRLEALEASSGAPPPPPAATPPSVFNPRITGFIDLVGSVTAGGEGITPSFDVRAFELDLRADIDPFAKAVVVLGFENPLLEAVAHAAEHAHEDEGEGEPTAEEVGEAWLSVVEEANISFIALPAHLLLELGMVRMDFGTSNRSHLHDLPHLDYASTATSLLGGHGWGDVGVFLRYRLHNPRSLPIDFKVGVSARGPEPLMEGRETPTPILLGRFTGSADVASGGLVQGGLSYAFWKDATPELRGFHLAGGDLLVKLRPPARGQYRSFFLQAEGFFAHRLGGTSSAGGVLGLGVQPARNVFISLRGDVLLEDITQPSAVRGGAGIAASMYTSEFLRFRVLYDALAGEHDVDHRFGLQVTAVFGAHPVEPYWVNR